MQKFILDLIFLLLKTIIKICVEFSFKKVVDTLSKSKGPDTSFCAMYKMHLISAKVKLYVNKDSEFAFRSVCGCLDRCLPNHRMFIHMFLFNKIVCDSD